MACPGRAAVEGLGSNWTPLGPGLEASARTLWVMVLASEHRLSCPSYSSFPLALLPFPCPEKKRQMSQSEYFILHFACDRTRSEAALYLNFVASGQEK